MEQTTVDRVITEASDDLLMDVAIDGNILDVGIGRVGHDGHAPHLASSDVTEATAIMWTLTSPEVHRLLRDGCGWSRERFTLWLEDTLVRTLLPDR